MVLGVFIEFFWSQNSHYRYFTDIFRNFTKIFSEIPAHERVRKKSLNFDKISGISDISSIFPILIGWQFRLGLADNRYFGDISSEKTEILFLAFNQLPPSMSSKTQAMTTLIHKTNYGIDMPTK